MLLTQEQLKSQLNYNAETGIFTRLVANSSKVKIGDIANAKTSRGYIRIKVLGKSYMAHCLAWLYMTGEWSNFDVDHKDLNKSNNAWNNLREATRQQNAKNMRLRSSNKSGYRGVYWHTQSQKWRSCDQTNGIKVYLGGFESAKEASVVYEAYAKEKHGDFYCAPSYVI